MRLIVLAVLAAALAAPLTGCGSPTEAQREMARISGEFERSLAANEACMGKVRAMPDYQLIERYLREGSPSLTERSNTAKATSEEIKAVYAVHDAMSDCRRDALKTATTISPAFGARMAEQYTRIDEVYREVAEGRMSWGEFARVLAVTRADAKKQMETALRDMARGFEAAHDAEVSKRRNLAREAIVWLFSSPPGPERTVCERVGKRLICTKE